jgi:hypothetical protein
MRSLIAVTASVALLVAQMPMLPAYADIAPPVAQFAKQDSGIIAEAFKAFPSGGDPLSMRIADIIVANPKLAPDLVIYLRNTEGLSRAQKLAAEHGLAAAADRLGIRGADLGTPPMITKDTVPVVEPLFDPWLIALSILAVGAAVCIAICDPGTNTPVVPAGSPH